MNYYYENTFYSLEMIDNQELADTLNQGWELVSMVPFRMAPEDGSTVVKEYLVTLRRPVETK
jgi:vacuolar-type H+-ATPase subunit B/Vma2